MPIDISSTMDGGNINVISTQDPTDIRLKIIPEPYTPYDKVAHFQWFYFRVAGAKHVPLVLHIVNAGESSFPEAWPGYQGCASYNLNPNGSGWFRVPTEYNESNGILTFRLTPEKDCVFFAYFAPFSYEQHLQLIAEMQCQHSDIVQHTVLGKSLQGRPIDLLTVSRQQLHKPGDKVAQVWIIARQHPGETMAEWSAEGFLRALTEESNKDSSQLLQKAAIHVVPNINPDGAVLGHLRTNALGANLNREWQAPSLDYAPEVRAVLDQMSKTGCDAFIDVHGDEEVTYVFLDGDEGIQSFGPKIAKLEDIFRKSLLANTSPDFQSTDFYGITKPGEAEMGIAANAVGERFHCFSVTLEMPFKDAARHPDRLHGWTAERSMQYGKNCIVPLLDVVNHIVVDDIQPDLHERKRKKKAG